MSFDLAKGEPRIARQQRAVSNRPGVIEEVDTRQRGRQIFGEMRNARRGDGGSGQALMEALGMVNKTVQQGADLNQEIHEKREGERADRGSLDAQLDTVDEELMQKSRGYSDAVALGRANTAWTEHEDALEPEFRAFIEGQEDLSLVDRQRAAKAWVEQNYFIRFALDPETGGVRNFGSPGAARAIAAEIGKNRPRLLQEANARIEQRFNGEALTHFTGAIRAGARKGSFDLNTAVQLLPPGIPQETVTRTYLETVQVVADELLKEGRPADAVRTIDQAMGYADAVDVLEVPVPGSDQTSNPFATTNGAPARPATVEQARGRIAIAGERLAALVMHQESRGNANAVSPKGAVGTMQTMPFTLKDPGFGVRPAANNSPAELERVGKDYLKAMGRRYSGNITLQLAAYNAGPGTVDDWLNGTNKTGKNPSKLKLPDPRQRGVSESAFWTGIPFKETKDYVRHITAAGGQPVAGAGGAWSTDVVVDEGNPNYVPPSPSVDLADRVKAPGLRILPELKGRFSMTAQQRSQMLSFRASVLNRGEAFDAEQKRKRTETVEGDFAMRAVGQGPGLTVEEIVGHPDLSERDKARWIGTVQSLREAEVARTRAAQQEADRVADRAREDSARSILESYGAGVFKGTMTPSQGMARLMGDLPHIRDPLVRSVVMSQASAFFRGVEGTRMETPAAREFERHTDGFEQGMAQSLTGRVLRYGNPPRPLQPDQAHGVVKAKVNELRVRGANQLRDTGKAPDAAAMRAELMSWLNQTFPPKPKVR